MILNMEILQINHRASFSLLENNKVTVIWVRGIWKLKNIKAGIVKKYQAFLVLLDRHSQDYMQNNLKSLKLNNNTKVFFDSLIPHFIRLSLSHDS